MTRPAAGSAARALADPRPDAMREQEIEEPLISVVIPAFNAEKFLEATISSALGQTLRPFEVIVVDDGSRDRTTEVAAGCGRGEVRVMPGGGRGVSAARNAGFAVARGDWIAFLDHDDLWERDKLERQAGLVLGDPGAVLVFTQAIVEHEAQGAPAARWPAGAATGAAAPQGEIFPMPEDPERLLANAYEELVYWNFIPMSSVMVRASALRGLRGPFDTRWSLSEDWDLWLRLARRHPRGLRFVNAPLTRYRIVGGRATARMADLRLEDLSIFEEQLAAEPWLEARNPARCRSARHRLRREAGYWLMKEGRGAEARPHLRAAWWSSPSSLRLLGYLAASLVRTSGSGGRRSGGDTSGGDAR